MNKYICYILVIVFIGAFTLINSSNYKVLRGTEQKIEERERILNKKNDNFINIDFNKEKLNDLSNKKNILEKNVIYHKDINLHIENIENQLIEKNLKKQLFKSIQSSTLNEYDEENNYISKMDFILSCTGSYEDIFNFIIDFNKVNVYETESFLISSVLDEKSQFVFAEINFSIYSIQNIENKKLDLDVKSIKEYDNPFYYSWDKESDGYE